MGGKVLKNLTLKGGKVSKKSSGRGPYVPETDMSTHRQHYSLESQAETIRAYAQCPGFSVVRTYSDAGRSGLRLKDRPGLMQLLGDVTSGGATFEAVLVYDVSRWGRFQDCDEAAHYEFICKSADVPVHYCAESFLNDNTLPSSILKALKRTMAAEYSREMGSRVFVGQKMGAELGFKQGGRPGYGLRRLMIRTDGQAEKTLAPGEFKSLRTDRVTLAPGPIEEIECVREMYRLVIEENRSSYYIARELNRRGVPCPTGKWRQQTIRRILTDPKYAGHNVWNRTLFSLGRPRVKKPKSHWVIKPGAFEPVIAPQLFDKTQSALAKQKEPYSNEELLKSVRGLLLANGKLSYRIIRDCPDFAGVNTLIKRFGTLRRAFELAGHNCSWTLLSRQYASKTKHFHNELLHLLTSLFPREVSVMRPDPEGRVCVQLDECVTVSIMVCPTIRRNGYLSWVADRRYAERKTVTLLARLSTDNTQFRDFYVLPGLGRHWIRHRGDLRHGKQLNDLSGFCAAVRAFVSHE
jgi:DNA invertase Pin-like site-specific DNA recombinase